MSKAYKPNKDDIVFKKRLAHRTFVEHLDPNNPEYTKGSKDKRKIKFTHPLHRHKKFASKSDTRKYFTIQQLMDKIDPTSFSNDVDSFKEELLEFLHKKFGSHLLDEKQNIKNTICLSIYLIRKKEHIPKKLYYVIKPFINEKKSQIINDSVVQEY